MSLLRFHISKVVRRSTAGDDVIRLCPVGAERRDGSQQFRWLHSAVRKSGGADAAALCRCFVTGRHQLTPSTGTPW